MQKYRKLKCIYRKKKRGQKQPGNMRADSEIDDELWDILNDAFSPRVGISGDILFDSHLEEEEDDDGEESESSTQPAAPSTSAQPAFKPVPIMALGNVLQSGMEAIAASLKDRATASTGVEVVAAMLDRHHAQTQRLMELELQILNQLLTSSQK